MRLYNTKHEAQKRTTPIMFVSVVSYRPISTSGAQFDMQCRYAEHLASFRDILGGQHSSIWRRFIAVSFHFHATSHTNYCLTVSTQSHQPLMDSYTAQQPTLTFTMI